MNVGAGQYVSSNCAMTILPMIPPSLAATIEIATPVALQNAKINQKNPPNSPPKILYRSDVGKISVIRQSSAALPHVMTELNTADTIKLSVLLRTKSIEAAQSPDEMVLKTVNKNIN